MCCRDAFQHAVISQLQFSTVFIKLTQQNSFIWDSQQIYTARTSTFPFPCHAICLSLTPVLGITQKAEEEMMPHYYPSPQRGARNICAALSKCCLSPAETTAHPKEASPAHICMDHCKDWDSPTDMGANVQKQHTAVWRNYHGVLKRHWFNELVKRSSS